MARLSDTTELHGDVLTLGIRDGIFHVGDRPYPWAELDNNDAEGGGFMWRERRARLRFESGWLLSVVFGDGTYSSNHDASFAERPSDLGIFKDAGPFSEEVRTAELGIWFKDSELLEWPSGDCVEGYVAAEVVGWLIEEMKTWPSEMVELPNLYVDRDEV